MHKNLIRTCFLSGRVGIFAHIGPDLMACTRKQRRSHHQCELFSFTAQKKQNVESPFGVVDFRPFNVMALCYLLLIYQAINVPFGVNMSHTVYRKYTHTPTHQHPKLRRACPPFFITVFLSQALPLPHSPSRLLSLRKRR